MISRHPLRSGLLEGGGVGSFRLTGVGSDIVLDGPCWVCSEFAIDCDGVVFRLVQNVNLLLVTKPHLDDQH